MSAGKFSPVPVKSEPSSSKENFLIFEVSTPSEFTFEEMVGKILIFLGLTVV